MDNPLNKLSNWINEEKNSASLFPDGAVLGTISKIGVPRSRVVGTMLDNNKKPKFFTSINSRKINDINLNKAVSLTYFFVKNIRSVSIEGDVEKLPNEELDQDWLLHDQEFRADYLIFGSSSGDKIDSLERLKKYKENSKKNISIRPESFVGYRLNNINRISFYSVLESDFASSEVYEWDKDKLQWNHSLLVP